MQEVKDNFVSVKNVLWPLATKGGRFRKKMIGLTELGRYFETGRVSQKVAATRNTVLNVEFETL